MESLSTIISGKLPNFKIIGTRKCESCGTSVQIIETSKGKVSRCLTCENNHLVKQATDYYKEVKANKIKQVFENYSLITDDLRNATFQNFIPDNQSKAKAKALAISYVDKFKDRPTSLLFQGSYGLGKSHLSYCIAKDIEEQGNTVIFINVPDLLTAFRDTYNKKTSESELLNVVKDVDLLVLDDVGAEYVKNKNGEESWAVDKLFQIINSRIGKPTIYTTNYESKDLIKKYGYHGGRIVSRMMQNADVIKMDGKDYRVNKN